MVLGDDLLKGPAEVAHQRAADAAGVHLGDVDARVLEEAPVDADFAELVFDEDQLLSLVALGDHFFDERGLASAQKAGVDIDFCHDKIHLLYKFCPTLYYITACQPLQGSFCKLISRENSPSPGCPGAGSLKK